jgi:hypothetical protein
VGHIDPQISWFECKHRLRASIWFPLLYNIVFIKKNIYDNLQSYIYIWLYWNIRVYICKYDRYINISIHHSHTIQSP